MDKIIATVLLIVGSVVASILVINSVYPAIVRGSNSLARVSAKVEARIESQVKVVYATAELDKGAVWQDVDSDLLFDVNVWLKNVGSARILGIQDTDVFFGTDGDFVRVPHTTDAGGQYPQWTYTIENGTDWINSVTVRFDIHYNATQSSDEYTVKLVVPTGAYDEHCFSF